MRLPSLSPLLAAGAFCVAWLPLVSSAAPLVFTTNLDGASESPPVVSDGVGLGIVTVDSSDFTMRVRTVFFGLTGSVTVAHIHCCTEMAGSGTVGVATTVPTFPDFPGGGTSGFYDVTFNMLSSGSWNPTFVGNHGASVETAFAALLAGLESGRAYLNIHSTFAPGGEIRGFLLFATSRPSEIFADGFEGP